MIGSWSKVSKATINQSYKQSLSTQTIPEIDQFRYLKIAVTKGDVFCLLLFLLLLLFFPLPRSQVWIKLIEIGLTVASKACTHLRWLDTVFQGQYLQSLSMNYVAINKVLEKLPPPLY